MDVKRCVVLCSAISKRVERGRRRGPGPHAGVAGSPGRGGGHGAGRRRCG